MSASVGAGALKHHFEDIEQQRGAERLGMWMFIATEIMFFGGIFLAYTIYRHMYARDFADISGRLNVLAHVLGRPYETILREFEGERMLEAISADSEGGTGDVKYHLGAHGRRVTTSGEIEVTLAANPSHLEAVNPSFAHMLGYDSIDELMIVHEMNRLYALESERDAIISALHRDSFVREAECQLIIKTSAGRLAELERRWPDLHPYELPEFLVLRPDQLELLEVGAAESKRTDGRGRDDARAPRAFLDEGDLADDLAGAEGPPDLVRHPLTVR